jgi:hypothetical protein
VGVGEGGVFTVFTPTQSLVHGSNQRARKRHRGLVSTSVFYGKYIYMECHHSPPMALHILDWSPLSDEVVTYAFTSRSRNCTVFSLCRQFLITKFLITKFLSNKVPNALNS